jgi:glucose/arabinose dehydrogenase
MVMGAKGTVFVGSRTARNVYALIDRNRDHKVDEVKIIATGLTQPSGIAIRNGSLYVGAITRILRYDNIEDKLDAPPEPVVVYDQLPNVHLALHRIWAGRLLRRRRAPCNICESLTIRASRPSFA